MASQKQELEEQAASEASKKEESLNKKHDNEIKALAKTLAKKS